MENKEFSVGSEVWSQADLYTKLKVLRHLILLDIYSDIALTGSISLDESLLLTPKEMVIKRYNGLKRMNLAIRQLLGNCLFTIKKKEIIKKTWIVGLRKQNYTKHI